ncbi:CGNR zinc finger domain-containing protein [Acidicapsa acidisoli]|uniref:CGNR zinc finger domain-containing protein n=1 Tax=Acidicapsa acidisoli TaxID=1615681 RepID=UPI0021DF6EBA|nr:CGNR zinc finger domain-containing protein [Acidicapsa acidisoli]
MPQAENAHVKPFELIAGHVALDLVNTVDHRFGPPAPQERLVTYDDLLRFALQSGIITDRQAKKLRRSEASLAERETILRQVRDLREALAAVAYAQLENNEIPASSLATLEDHFKQAAARRHLVAGNLLLVWNWSGLSREIAAPWWRLSQAAADLLLSDQSAHIRCCSSETCRWLFLDTSKNHTRRWCEMKTCGNRMKARRFHARQSENE